VDPVVSSVDVGPRAAGVRLPWAELPAAVRDWVGHELGAAVVEAVTQPGGFSPGVAARLRCADGTRAFCKAVSELTNTQAAEMHRREAAITAALPVSAPVPRLLTCYDDGTWVALLFQDVAGRQPSLPWRADELTDVLKTLADASTLQTKYGQDFSGWRLLAAGPAVAVDRLDPWSRRHLGTLAALESEWADAAVGETLVHCDIRADNLLLCADRVWVVDWPAACKGAAWFDVMAFAPSVAMQGGPLPEELLARHPAARGADPDAVLSAACALAGYFTLGALQPPPPGLPTVRPFQAAQARVARAWLARRTGWR
jgi:hypothetical protein